MAIDRALVAWVADALAPLGTVTSRPMMSGAALYLDGTVFALQLQDTIWFKADAGSAPAWDAAGCAPFCYQARGRTVVTSYRRAPDDVHDDADALREWAALALAAARRAPAKGRRGR